MSIKLEDLGSVKEVYNTGLVETEKGFRLPKKVSGVIVKKGQQLVREKGQVRVVTTEDKKVLKAQEKVVKTEIEAAKSEASKIIETAKAEALKIIEDAKEATKENVPEKNLEISETEK